MGQKAKREEFQNKDSSFSFRKKENSTWYGVLRTVICVCQAVITDWSWPAAGRSSSDNVSPTFRATAFLPFASFPVPLKVEIDTKRKLHENEASLNWDSRITHAIVPFRRAPFVLLRYARNVCWIDGSYKTDRRAFSSPKTLLTGFSSNRY